MRQDSDIYLHNLETIMRNDVNIAENVCESEITSLNTTQKQKQGRVTDQILQHCRLNRYISGGLWVKCPFKLPHFIKEKAKTVVYKPE